MLDLLIKGGLVVDGTGAPPRRADVGIRAGRIVAIGEIDEPADEVVSVDGRVVAPGFVDIHTHYDAQVLWDSACTPSPFHGVTSVVGGNCGFTIAPIADSEIDYITRMLARVEGMPLESLVAGVPYSWRSFGEYLDRVEEGGLTVNAGFLVGHSAIRRVVMGDDALKRPATPDELDQMCTILAESLRAGGLGFSSTRAPSHNDANGDPVPSRHAAPDELVALARVAGEHEGTTLELIPGLGVFGEEQLDLMASMSSVANRPLNWNVLAPSAPRAEMVRQQLAASDYAAERGGRVLALTVPTLMRTYINLKSGFILDVIPGWQKAMALPVPEKIAMLSDPEQRRALVELADAPEAEMVRPITQWNSFLVAETFSPENAGLAGRSIGDITAERGDAHPFDTICEIAINDDLRTVFLPQTASDDPDSWALRAEVWRDGRAIVGASDAGAHLDMSTTFNYTTGMLRAAREHDLMPVEEVVHLITDVPARLYGLRERGRIEEGWHADLVVFDPDNVGPADIGWRDDLPAGAGRLYGEAEGVDHVFVNGVEIVRKGALTGAQPGVLFRSGRDTETVTARTS